MTRQSIRINDHTIGPDRPTYVIAEMSGNHNGSYQRASALLRAARDAGADAVKLQTYTADTMTLRIEDPLFRLPPGGLWGGRTLYDLYDEAHMPWEWQPRLLREARQLGIDLLSTPFDATAVEFLEKLAIDAYKVASFEITDLDLIGRIAATGRPVIISTGMATKAEIAEAVEAARAGGAAEIVLLRCTSEYPADPADMDLRTIMDLEASFGVPVGLSDHSLGTAVPVAAVALGACVIEKHLTLSRSDGGPDAGFSLEPEELSRMIQDIRIAERARGRVRYGPAPAERENLVFRRSLFVVERVPAGGVLTSRNVRAIRPGYGLSPRHFREVIGRRAARDIAPGTPLTWDLISDEEARPGPEARSTASST